MDLSALIFVALAVAWAIYLIPKALKQHEDGAASRTVDGFSGRMRVLARREAVDSKSARLVVPGRPAAVIAAEPAAALDELVVEVELEVEPVVAEVVPRALSVPLTPQQHRARRAASARAARRRMRVVATIFTAIVAVGVVSGAGVIPVPYTLVPVGLLVAWLVACRVMVKKERATYVAPLRRAPETPDADVDDPVTEEIAVVEAELAVEPVEPVAADEPTPAPAPGGWDPVPVTLPTYVAKEPAARRTVRTIDLDSTGVWSSGPSASDSALARGAEEADRAAKAAAAEAERRRASGS